MLPQLGAGGCWPRPRNDRLASAMTAAAIASVACTISGAHDVRQHVAQRDAQVRVAERARRLDVVLDLDASTCARVRRTKIGVAEMPIAIIALVRLGPRKAASAIARIRNGQASNASVRREISAVGPAAEDSRRAGRSARRARARSTPRPRRRAARRARPRSRATARRGRSRRCRTSARPIGALRIALQLVAIGS